MRRALWSIALAAGLLWPAHSLSLFDGLPLDGTAEAIVLGMVVPFLWVAHRGFMDGKWVRAAILALVALKIVDAWMVTPQGLCLKFSTAAPYTTTILTIPIIEPQGVLRSWDLRTRWRDDAPTCTAIMDRPYATAQAFPAWFVNITDFASRGRRDLTMDLSGALRVEEPGRFAIDLDRDMSLGGRIGSQAVSSQGGAPLEVALEAGVHRIDLHGRLTGDRWRLAPTWNGRDAFAGAALTAESPRVIDRTIGRAVGPVGVSLIVVLVAAWMVSLAVEYLRSPWLLVWCGAAASVLAVCGATGRFDRFCVPLLLAAVFVPVDRLHRNRRGLLLLVGLPWLALFVVRAIPQIGRFSAYSSDDWLAYQVAGYRIFMSGFWLEGGSRTFDYQPLYRWLSGALHLGFGDSSVGEVYWDAACLLAGGTVAFTLVKERAGFRWAVGAAAATLATFTSGTIWYFPGRGLSEIAAAGFAFFAALSLLGGGSRLSAAAGAGVLAVLMFYTRLNHLPFALFLLALLLPPGTPSAWRRAWTAIRRLDPWSPVVYLATFSAGVAVFVMRTWWYTGVFSLLYGTALRNNDTGLRLSTIGSPMVWQKVLHSLGSLVWLNEPPAFDVRSVLVVAGMLLSVLALLQVPRFSRLPLSIALVTVSAAASSVLAHTHAYPGRMSVHLVPFALAMTMVAAASLWSLWSVKRGVAASWP